MSNSNSTSHAAALAAFKGMNSKKEEKIFSLPSCSIKSHNITSRTSTQEVPKVSRHVSANNISKLQNEATHSSVLKSPLMDSPSTPGKLVIPKSSHEQNNFNKKLKSRDYFSFKNEDDKNLPVSSSSEQFIFSRSSAELKKPQIQKSYSQTNAKDMIKNIKSSINALAIPVDVSRRRISGSYEPQEMIKNVRQSINSKAKLSSQSSEMSSKNQAIINGIRESIDSKRISSSVTDSSLVLPALDNKKPSYGNISEMDYLSRAKIHETNKFQNNYNNSCSSLGSAFSEEDFTRTSGVPPILIEFENLDSKNDETIDGNANYADEELTNIDPYRSQSSFDEKAQYERENFRVSDVQRPYLNFYNMSPSSPSSSKSAYSFTGPSESAEALLPPSDAHFSQEKEIESNNQGLKVKPKRKPPPRMDKPDTKSNTTSISEQNDFGLSSSGTDSQFKSKFININSTTGDELSSPKYLTDNDDYSYYTDGEIESKYDDFENENIKDKIVKKLPQFPNIDDKVKNQREHKHQMFKKHGKGKNSDYNLSQENTDETSDSDLKTKVEQFYISSRPSTPQIHQPVQLKTTMRKTNKKKEKKMLFNEYKPWKNHNDLTYITEQERKRYEGVWASNRGLYMNCVVTKLAGVDYEIDSAEKAYDEIEIPRKAAQLSSNGTNLDPSKLADHLKFHNVTYAEINQLIHGSIVKRIWQRSRLPDETLEAIWYLIDFRKDGSLNKPEFLVGMWLIDQSLYGRKLPKKVDDIVWESLGNIGVNVIVKKTGRR